MLGCLRGMWQAGSLALLDMEHGLHGSSLFEVWRFEDWDWMRYPCFHVLFARNYKAIMAARLASDHTATVLPCSSVPCHHSLAMLLSPCLPVSNHLLVSDHFRPSSKAITTRCPLLPQSCSQLVRGAARPVFDLRILGVCHTLEYEHAYHNFKNLPPSQPQKQYSKPDAEPCTCFLAQP